jgi:hypothetical protein
MKSLRVFLLVLVLPFFAFTTMHKYYVSVTQINYIKEKQSVQITSRLFIDDFENVLKQNFDEDIVLVDETNPEMIDDYMARYLKTNIKLIINGKAVTFNFIGKEYEGDIVKCYLEIENVKSIESFQVTNRVLFDLEKNQQNIVKTKINSKNKSVILTFENPKALLKFN